MSIDAAVREWLERGEGRIGEVVIVRMGHGFRLCHHADDGPAELRIFSEPEDAREIARFDDDGNFRPLKCAPNLRRGWTLCLASQGAVRLALDFFYPAMLGTWLAAREKRLLTVDFRDTANRQSGMYAVVKKISDDDADTLIGRFCRSGGGCLKTILWKIDAERPVVSLPSDKFDLEVHQLTGTRDHLAIPLPCSEACSLLIAEARSVVKLSSK